MHPEQKSHQNLDAASESLIESDDESQSQADVVAHTNDDSILFLSDDEEIGISELSEEDRSRTASASSASTAAHPILNNLILLSITTEKIDGKIKIMFSRERANTVLGEKQGDHVISHRLFVELLNNKLKDAKISEIPTIIINTMEEIIPDFSKSESLLTLKKENLKKTKFPSEILVADASQDLVDLVKENFELGDRQKRVTKLNAFLSSVIQTYNALDDVSYVKRGSQGEKGKNEGTITHQSVCALQAINEFLEISRITDPKRQEEHQLELFCKLLAVNGEYCDAATLLFGKSKIEEVRAEFNIPNDGLSPEVMKKRLDPSTKIRQGTKIPDFGKFCRLIREKSLDTDIVAELFNNCFDFQYYDINTQATNSKKTGHEAKRDDDKSDPDKLYDLASRYIVMTFQTFPELKDINVSELIKKFTDFLYQDQKWRNCEVLGEKLTTDTIFIEINKRTDLNKPKIIRDHTPINQLEALTLGK